MRRFRHTVFIFLFIFLPAAVSAADKDKKNQSSLLETPFQAAGGLLGSVFDLGNILVGGKRLGSPFHDFVSSNLSSSSVLSREDMELSAARNLPEAFDAMPGVVLSDLSGNGEEPTLDFRGFNQGRDTLFTLDVSGIFDLDLNLVFDAAISYFGVHQRQHLFQ